MINSQRVDSLSGEDCEDMACMNNGVGKVLRYFPERSAYCALMHMHNILCLTPLHEIPLPYSAWRLLLDFAACEHSFCHNIIPHFVGTCVFMCIPRDITQHSLIESCCDDTA